MAVQGKSRVPAEAPADRKRALIERCFSLGPSDGRLVDQLCQYATLRRVQAGEIIFHKGDPGDALYAIMRGSVRVFVESADMREVLLNVLQPDAVLGVIALLSGNSRTASASAMEDSELLTLNRSHFLPLLKREPELGIRVIAMLCELLHWTSAAVEDAAFLDTSTRLAKRLLFLAEVFGQQTEKGIEFRIRLSQRLIASMLMVSREVVNKLLMSWRDRQIVDIVGGRIVLKNKAYLIALLGVQ